MKKVLLIIIVFLIFLITLSYYKSSSYNFINIMLSNDYQIVEEVNIDSIVFTLDMQNLKSNENKIIYVNDECNIKIYSVKLLPNGQYDIIFSTNGKFDKNGGIIFTGNSYNDMLNHKPELYSEDNVYWYLSSIHRLAKDNGDYFGFSISKKEITDNKIILNLEGIVKITIKKHETK